MLVTGSAAAFGFPALEVAAKSFGENRQLLKSVHQRVVCPWSPKHPRHDHQLIFPLDQQRVLLVWSEYYSKPENPEQKIGQSFVFYSDNGFKTWKRSADSMTAPGRGCHEPTIVELKDGRLFCLMRNTTQVQYFSISEDGGDHWTESAPTVLTSPESPALLKRIALTGDILVLWNNVASKSNWPRTPLCSAISTDEGQTWQHVNDIDNRADRDAAYPSVTFVGDEALVAYYSRSTKWKRDAEVILRIFGTEQFYTS